MFNYPEEEKLYNEFLKGIGKSTNEISFDDFLVLYSDYLKHERLIHWINIPIKNRNMTKEQFDNLKPELVKTTKGGRKYFITSFTLNQKYFDNHKSSIYDGLEGKEFVKGYSDYSFTNESGKTSITFEMLENLLDLGYIEVKEGFYTE